MSQILLHIGFGKAGSTYLQEWFVKHPSLYYQPKHIAGGFTDAWALAKHVQFAEKAPEAYIMSCEDLAVWKGQPRLYGLRGTKPYDYRKFENLMCEMLHGIYPTAKVLMVTRGYTTIFNSIYSMYLGMTGTYTFKQMVKNQKEMFSVMHDYTYMVNLYRQKYGAENVIVLPYELLRDNPTRFLSLIEEKLGVKQHFPFHSERVNASYDKKVLGAYFMVSKFVFNILKPLPMRWKNNIYKKYTATFRGQSPHPLMKFLSRFMDSKISMEGIDEMLEAVKGRAEILRNEELYQPYLKDYLL